jgi:hypothetical protein
MVNIKKKNMEISLQKHGKYRKNNFEKSIQKYGKN